MTRITNLLFFSTGGLACLTLLVDITTLADVDWPIFFQIGLHLLLLLNLVLFFVLVKRRILPEITFLMEHLNVWSAHLEQGDFSYRLPSSGHAELDMLVHTLNRLSEEVVQREVELRTINAALNARSLELAALSRQTIAAEEEERRRVARELHDGLGQVMAATKMTLDLALITKNPTKQEEYLQEVSKAIGHAMDELHTISQGLRPAILDDLGLKEALEWYLQQFHQRFHIPVEYNFDEIGSLHLTPECEITAYRFLQEALTNVYKHAQASRVTIKLRHQANFIMLSVNDNGRGFDRRRQEQNRNRLSLGLTGLQERLALVGGELIIHSQPERGTTLIALLPMAAEAHS